jgi:hypothetical protein
LEIDQHQDTEKAKPPDHSDVILVSEEVDNRSDNESTQSGNICSQPLDRKAFCGTSLSEPTALMEVVPDDENF